MNLLNQFLVLGLLLTTAFVSDSVVGQERVSSDLKVQSRIEPDPTPPREFGRDYGILRMASFQEPDQKPSEDVDLQESLSDRQGTSSDGDMELDFEDEIDQEREDRRPARADFGPWPRKGIRAIRLDVRDRVANQPEDRSAQLLNSGATGWTQFAPTQKVFAWVAPNIRYQPLYFEDVALERYGQTAPDYRQSILSGYHFFKSLNSMPYRIAFDEHPWSCNYPLGFCRPGNTVDYTIDKRVFPRR